jgi:transcriptional regulator with XRE-family HTH domain
VDQYEVPTRVRATPAFAKRLRDALDASSSSLRDLQRETGVDKNTISSWQRSDSEAGPSTVSVEKVVRVAQALGLDPWLLLGLPGPRTPAPTDRESLIRELDRELGEMEDRAEAISGELAVPLKELERLSSAIPELRELAAKALGER